MQHTINFVKQYYPHAFLIAQKKGYDAVAILAQAALESGWGQRVKGNNFFGIKDTDGVNGNEQLIKTREVLRSSKARFSVIHSIKKLANGLWEYFVSDYFRKYDSAWESFLDYTLFLERNSKYRRALESKSDGLTFLQLIAEAGYATDPNYAKSLISLYTMIDRLVNQHIKL